MSNFLRSRSESSSPLKWGKPWAPLPKKWISLLITGVILAAVGGAAVVSYKVVRQIILDNLKAKALLQVQRSSNDIDEWVGGLSAQLEADANNGAVRSMDWTIARPFLQLEFDRSPDFFAFNLVNLDGSYYTTKVGFVKGKTLSDRPHFKQTATGKVNVSDLVIARSTGIRQILITVPIWSVPPFNRGSVPSDYAATRADNLAHFQLPSVPDRPPQIIGQLWGAVPVDHVQEVIAQITDNNGSYAFALDAQGVLIAHPNHQRLESAQSIVQEADSNLAAVGRLMLSKQSGVKLMHLDGDWVYVAYTPLQRSGWSLAQVIPRGQLEQNLLGLNVLASVLGMILVMAAVIALRLIQLLEHTHLRAEREAQQSQQLNQAIQELRQTQSQLIQSEKMSGLGQLVAGVAHEINNPISFIFGNLNHLREYTRSLLHLIALYQHYYPEAAPAIQSEAEAIDLEFVQEDLPKILESMKMGSDRIRQIVLSLRNFSRLDQAEMKPVDIHEGIDSTLMILQSRLKAKSHCPDIEIIKEYGNLPEVECYAGQLNQVFMNILANAVDALEANPEFSVSKPELQNSSTLTPDLKPQVVPQIQICTEVRMECKHVVIRIADNGCGMSETVKQQLFNPFFTTKPVGAGTGLGLSVSYQIVVDKHHGILKCTSAPGKGTEFWIEIPLCQAKVSNHTVKAATPIV
jgi:two-component system NtrC family sensor kinase